MRFRARAVALAAAAILAATAPALPAAADSSQPSSTPPRTIDLDVLYVGAHPDDEAFALAALGQWNELEGLRAGVVTVTRGEGGGNAVGLEEGPALGLLREDEERRAVAHAGIRNIYNLDKLDFFYTASAPLTREIWGGEDTLARVVRVVRATRPEVIVTMNPSPTPGNHGNHQEAARLAVEAYHAAADPEAFGEQLGGEELEPWAAGRVLRAGAFGEGVTGPACETTPYRPEDPTDRVFGTWQGRVSRATGETWARREWRAQTTYASQGWAGFEPPPGNPAEIECDWFTVIDSRTPVPAPGSAAARGPAAALAGAAVPAAGGLPLGAELTIDSDAFEVLPATPFAATVQVRAGERPLRGAKLRLTAPAGWAVEQDGEVAAELASGDTSTVDVTVTPPEGAPAGQRVNLTATLTLPDGASGANQTPVEVANPVRGRLAPRPEVGVFYEWTEEQDLPELRGLITPTVSVGSGRGQEVTVEVTNHGPEAAGGGVALRVPRGFTATPAEQRYDGLAPGAATSLTFTVENTDASLPTANRAPGEGYPFRVVTATDGGARDVQEAVLELVPSTTVPQAASAPRLDGRASHAEYPGAALDTSTLWEGDEASQADVSATTRVSFTPEALHVYVDVTDDRMGTVLEPADCKRHWRTDSVEITIDPRGASSNTSTTFKTGIFPTTDDPARGNPPCFERDADNHQGPGPETAPGMRVASVVRGGGRGYTVEASIPFEVLPDAVDPERMGLNVLVYDSDTQDRTGQTRIGWSTFEGVQADPFRWGLASLPGLEAAAPAPQEPVLPDTAARSVDSPQSIAQSAADGVPLGGGPGLPAGTVTVTAARVSGSTVSVGLDTTRSGQANLFVWDGRTVLGKTTAELPGGPTTLQIPVRDPAHARQVLVAFTSGEATQAAARPIS